MNLIHDQIDKELTIELLGRPQLICNGKRLDENLLQKARALLFYLAATDKPHTRERLAGLLWGDMPDEKARVNLRTALSRLRRVVENCVVADRRTIALVGGVSVDVALFLNNIHSNQAETLQQAITLYRGDLLTDFYVRGAPDFEEWLLVERERLRQMMLDGLHRATLYCESARKLNKALEFAQRSLEIDPWREATHRDVIRLLLASGQRSAALAQFERCKMILHDELGVELTPATTLLAEQIRNYAAPSTAYSLSVSSQMPVNTLPHVATSFHGREVELMQISATLGEPGCRLLTLVGMGGIGKSRLAIEAGRTQAGTQFTDGLFWVPLADVENRAGVVQAIANALDVSLSGRGSPDRQLLDRLRERRVLLVLDNLEQLIEDAPFFSDLLEAAPHVKLLATSRERLNLVEEWVLQIGGLPFAEQPAPTAAFALFVERARRHNLGFSIAENQDAVARICSLMEGLPLGIELATAWIHVSSCSDVANTIENRLNELIGEQNRPKRHHSIEAVLDHSWELLTEVEQAVLARLSVFRGGFSADAACAIAQSDRRTLATLVEKSLVQYTTQGRYDLHSLIRQLLESRVVDSAETAQRHLTWFADMLHKRTLPMLGREQIDTVRSLLPDEANLRVAMQYAIEIEQSEQLESLVVGMTAFLNARGLHEATCELLQPALDRLDTAANYSDSLRAKLLIRYAGTRQYVSRAAAETVPLLRSGLAIAQSMDDQLEVANAWIGLGYGGLFSGDYANAEDAFLQAAEAAKSAGAFARLGVALQMRGYLLSRKGRGEDALPIATRAVTLLREYGSPLNVAAALTTLGNAHNNAGRHVAAEAIFQEVLQISRSMDHAVGTANALTGLFATAFHSNRWDAALRYSDESLRLYTEAGDWWGVAIAQHNTGAILVEREQFTEAKRWYRDSAETYEKIGSRSSGLANSLSAWGMACVQLGEFTEAQAVLQRALELAVDIDSARFVDKTLLQFGRLFLALGKSNRAAPILAHVSYSKAATVEVKNEADVLLARCPETEPIPVSILIQSLLAEYTADRNTVTI